MTAFNKPCTFEKKKRIGFISTRFNGTDGVSLETVKWTRVLTEMGHECFFFAGDIDKKIYKNISHSVPEAHFNHPEIKKITKACFNEGKFYRPREITKNISRTKHKLKRELYKFIKKFNIDLLIPENCLAIPMNIPLGMALTRVVAESGIPTISHHHDFFWERKRFLRNNAMDYLRASFPPNMLNMQHVVINSEAQNQLSFRTGISSTIIPNVWDFNKEAPEIDEYSKDIRREFGIRKKDHFILQPTRVVQRKGIEHAIELVSRLKLNTKLVISHSSGDEGNEYERRVRRYARLMGVDALFLYGRIHDTRGTTKDGKKQYSLWDVYPHSDMITYPSTYEGFGNAFVEAIYFKKPIVVNNYSIYATDIKPLGFNVIEFDDFITEKVVKKTRDVLLQPEKYKKKLEHNFEIAKKHFSFEILKNKLNVLLMNCNFEHKPRI